MIVRRLPKAYDQARIEQVVTEYFPSVRFRRGEISRYSQQDFNTSRKLILFRSDPYGVVRQVAVSGGPFQLLEKLRDGFCVKPQDCILPSHDDTIRQAEREWNAGLMSAEQLEQIKAKAGQSTKPVNGVVCPGCGLCFLPENAAPPAAVPETPAEVAPPAATPKPQPTEATPRYACAQCGKTFASQYAANGHARIHGKGV